MAESAIYIDNKKDIVRRKLNIGYGVANLAKTSHKKPTVLFI